MKQKSRPALDRRYPPNWNQLSDLTLRITLGQCSNCWWRRARLAHHTWYPWYGLQRPLLCLFPVCRKCHGIAHRQRNWKTNNWYAHNRNKQDDHNTLGFYVQLLVKTMLLIACQWSLIGYGLFWLFQFFR